MHNPPHPGEILRADYLKTISKPTTLLGLLVFLFSAQGSADVAAVGDSRADGDATLLASYEVPAAARETFEAAAKAAADRASSSSPGTWLLYEEPLEKVSVSRFFTVHFPDDLDELTEPKAAPWHLINRMGQYRVDAELWRQVPDWCSTTRMDPDLHKYAYVEYLWLSPDSLAAASRLLAARGLLLREIYGTSASGNAAAEGFVAMVAPASVMFVLFSPRSDREAAQSLVEQDLAAADKLSAWKALHSQLDALVVRRAYRDGTYRADLSVP